MADRTQHFRTELNETVNGGLDMLNGIAAPKPHRRPQGFRQFMSDLLCMQAWSKEGETLLVRVERTDKIDGTTLAVEFPDEKVRTSEVSRYQVLRRTTANEPTERQQTQGQREPEAWREIARRYDQRNMSRKKPAYAARINEIEPETRSNLTTSRGRSPTRQTSSSSGALNYEEFSHCV